MRRPPTTPTLLPPPTLFRFYHAAHGRRDPPVRGQRDRPAAGEPRSALARRGRAEEPGRVTARQRSGRSSTGVPRSEEHTSELQSRQYLVCRLLLEKKKIESC